MKQNFSRRNFLKTGSLALAGLALRPETILAAEKKKAKLSIQLYSVRDDMGKNPLATLTEISKMGYRYVEHANYVDRKFYGYSAKEFKKVLNGLGMKMPSGHTVLARDHWDAAKKDFTDKWKYLVEDAATVGQKYVISPWLDDSYRKSYDELMWAMDWFNKCGALCQKSGMKFGYHNHHFEFSEKLNGKKIYDIMLQNTDPNLVAQQLDTGNLYNGGGIALDIVKQYPGRFELFHVKDEILSNGGHEKYESTILGKGIVDLKNVVDLGRKSGGTKIFVVEQESYQGKTPLECAREDYQVMKSWGY